MEAQRQKWMQSMYAEEEEATKVLSKSFEENVVPLIKEGEKVISPEGRKTRSWHRGTRSCRIRGDKVSREQERPDPVQWSWPQEMGSQ